MHKHTQTSAQTTPFIPPTPEPEPHERADQQHWWSHLRRYFALNPSRKVGDITKQDGLDLTSRETHQRLKESNKDVLLATNNRRFWSGWVNMFGTAMMSGAILALNLAAPSAWLMIASVLAGTTVMLVAHYISQSATAQANDNTLDVGDYYNRRQASYIAKEIKKVFSDSQKTAPDAPAPEAQISSQSHWQGRVDEARHRALQIPANVS